MSKNIGNITVKCLIEDDYDVFETLYKHHYNKLCAYAHNYTSDNEIAQNAVQDAFLSLWNNRKNTIITTSIKSYL